MAYVWEVGLVPETRTGAALDDKGANAARAGPDALAGARPNVPTAWLVGAIGRGVHGGRGMQLLGAVAGPVIPTRPLVMYQETVAPFLLLLRVARGAPRPNVPPRRVVEVAGRSYQQARATD